jgi:competence protein ComGC
MTPQMNTDKHRSLRAFTLTELLVVAGVVALLIALRLPAMCRGKTPVQLLQCLSNCRQIGTATALYGSDNEDAFPFGNRISSGSQVTDPTGWPMQLLRYMGGYTNSQPKVCLCPSETGLASGWTFQLHYQGNRMLLSDTLSTESPIYHSQVRKPDMYWLITAKGPYDFISIKPGGLANPVLAAWNYGSGYPPYRRHSGGMSAAAAPTAITQPAPGLTMLFG